MTDPLYIDQEDPINFNGTIDALSALQLLHGSDSLADYGQIALSEHDDLLQSTGIVRVNINDFTSGGYTWTITVAHDPGGGVIAWSRGTALAYYDFGPMTALQEFTVTATSDHSPPQTKNQTCKIQISPTGSLPDRPRR
jgi:hypothetical protein